MAETKPWTRFQDWAILAAGVVLALSPIWVTIDLAGTWALAVIGGVVAAMALVALAMPGAYIDEWITAVGGVAAFVAPWVFSYTSQTAAAWTSWVVGIVVVVAALAAVPSSRLTYKAHHHAHHGAA
jgi:hypothetical protein